MIRFYQRAGRHLFYEVRLRQDGPGFELGITAPDGPVLTELFDTEEELSKRFLQLDEALSREGWGRCDSGGDSDRLPGSHAGRAGDW